MDTIFFSQNLPQMATETIYIIRATIGNNSSYSIKKKQKGSTSTKTLTNQEFMNEMFKPELAYEIPEIIVNLAKAGTDLISGYINLVKVTNICYDSRYSVIQLRGISATISGDKKEMEISISANGISFRLNTL